MKPRIQSVALPLINLYTTLHLNAFRRVRAISQFDWPFTLPTGHPKTFSTSTGSVLHSVLPELQPAMGRSQGFASNPTNYAALFRLAFAPAPVLNTLTSLVKLTRRLIMQKARRHSITLLRPLVGVRFQVLFHPSIRSAFTFPSQYLFTIGLSGVFSLEDGPHIQTGFPHVSRPTHLSSLYAFRVQDYHLL